MWSIKSFVCQVSIVKSLFNVDLVRSPTDDYQILYRHRGVYNNWENLFSVKREFSFKNVEKKKFYAQVLSILFDFFWVDREFFPSNLGLYNKISFITFRIKNKTTSIVTAA